MTGIVRAIALVAAFLSAVLVATSAQAACSNPTNCSCSISTSGLVFGTYNAQSSGPTDSVGTISATCTFDDPGNSTFSIALSPGNSGNATQREMAGAEDRLLYNLYTDATRSTIWGDDGGGGFSVVTAFPASSGSTRTISVYARIPAQQRVVPGGYNDLITVTISY